MRVGVAGVDAVALPDELVEGDAGAEKDVDGVMDGVSELDGVMDGVRELDGVGDGVADGETPARCSHVAPRKSAAPSADMASAESAPGPAPPPESCSVAPPSTLV